MVTITSYIVWSSNWDVSLSETGHVSLHIVKMAKIEHQGAVPEDDLNISCKYFWYKYSSIHFMGIPMATKFLNILVLKIFWTMWRMIMCCKAIQLYLDSHILPYKAVTLGVSLCFVLTLSWIISGLYSNIFVICGR